MSQRKPNRYFQVIYVASKDGEKGKSNHFRVRATTPSGAARKAGTKICRMTAVKGQCTLHIKLKEDTRGSRGKEYDYTIKRSKLTPAEPVIMKKTGTEVVFNYVITATAVGNNKPF